MPVSVELTDGWTGCGLSLKDSGSHRPGMLFGFWQATNIYTDRCQWLGAQPNPPVGPGVDELATAIAALEWSSSPVDATIDGFAGRLVRVEIPTSADVSDCDLGEFKFFDGPGTSERAGPADLAPGWVEETWIVDVAGDRVVVTAGYFADRAATDQPELYGIVESIDFAP